MSFPSTADEWADRFGHLRRSGPGALSAWVGIPLVVSALLGMLWVAPVPAILAEASPVINPATLTIMATFVYYCILSIRLAIGGLLFLIAAALPSAWLEQAGMPVWLLASAVFTVAFAWQLVETLRATGQLLVLSNLQYVMLGPVWLLRALYRRLGIPY